MSNKNNNNGRESWTSNAGFLFAAVGSAVGLGNLWAFPFKMGANGGFAFLLVYLVLVVVAGYPLIMTELALGRRTGKSIIPAYKACSNGKMTIVGVFGALSPFFILGFYCYLGGYALEYAIANFGDIFGASWGVGGVEGAEYFTALFTNQGKSVAYTLVFIGVTIFIVARGIKGGIEKFNTFAMPALTIILIITAIRSCTLPGSSEGLAFILKPNFEPFAGTGWVKVLASAGGQAFFSLSLAMGILVTFGSYMDKDVSIARNGIIIPLADTAIALLASFAIMPAVFAFGMEPGAGPGLLYMTLQNVFNSMGSAGAIFGFLFYALVVLAALTSSISVLEAIIASFIDGDLDKGKGNKRIKYALIFGAITAVMGVTVALDGLGTYLPMWFGKWCWLDGYDLLAEGVLMPVGALLTVIYFGWFRKGYIQEEISSSSAFKGEKFFTFCLKFIAPLFCMLILVGQLDSFFGWGLFS